MDPTQAKSLGVGGALITAPVWSLILQDVSLIASTVAAVCGAIIGIRAVWLIVTRAGR